MKSPSIISSLLSAILFISGCATTTATTSLSGQSDTSNRLNVDGLSNYEKIQAYENQLIKSADEPHATLTVLQSVRDYRTASLAANPLGVYAIDGVPVKKLPYSIFRGSGWLEHAIRMSLADVKIPAGKHKVEFGQITAWNTSDYTFPEVDFEPNKQYIVVFGGQKGDRNLSIYTYKFDSRFSRLDRDSIILKDKVTTIAIR